MKFTFIIEYLDQDDIPILTTKSFEADMWTTALSELIKTLRGAGFGIAQTQ